MKFDGKMAVKSQVPMQKMWDALLNDPEILCAVIPGGEKVERVDDKTFNVVLKQGIGPFKFKFNLRAVLVKTTPPTYAEIEGEGQDVTKLGNFKMKMVLNLKNLGAGDIEIAYEVYVTVGGKLGAFGDRILNAKAKSMEKDLVANLNEALKNIA
jgi:carbon monoxide dehydrogenase subunit G